jgi:hypothetical protein
VDKLHALSISGAAWTTDARIGSRWKAAPTTLRQRGLTVTQTCDVRHYTVKCHAVGNGRDLRSLSESNSRSVDLNIRFKRDCWKKCPVRSQTRSGRPIVATVGLTIAGGSLTTERVHQRKGPVPEGQGLWTKSIGGRSRCFTTERTKTKWCISQAGSKGWSSHKATCYTSNA